MCISSLSSVDCMQETEGQDMRETVQDKINAWFVEHRHPETGEYPDFPDQEEGGRASAAAAAAAACAA
jgi:hypothetical protein